jgi:acyl carrier protein
MLELIAFLEEAFGLRIADAEMTPENLDSIDAITAFVGRKTEKLSASA